MNELVWFGKDYGAPLYRECKKIATPAGVRCRRCKENIKWGEDGFIDAGGWCFHRACFLRGIFGSVSHQLKTCSCFHGGLTHDDAAAAAAVSSGMTVRQEAEKAVELYEKLHADILGESELKQ